MINWWSYYTLFIDIILKYKCDIVVERVDQKYSNIFSLR